MENVVGNLLKYFSNPKKWNHTIRLYKNVPISHIRISNPERNYIWDEEYYIRYFQELPIEKVISLLNILKIALNDYSIFNTEDEAVLLKSPEIISLPKNDIDILKTINQLLRTLVFIDELDDNDKFADPITATLNDNNLLSIHPGKTRTGIMEYLFLKNKKEYYVDVIFYKSKMSGNHYDGFLMDKEYTTIKTLSDFTKAYGYKSVTDFFVDFSKINLSILIGATNNYYLNKHTIIPKEKFIDKFSNILQMVNRQTTE